ncbi:MAG: hypothetical protein ACHQ2Z_01260 [Elusimicrobiota bacterium]
MTLSAVFLALSCALAPASAHGAAAAAQAGVAVDTAPDAATLTSNARYLLDVDELKAALADAEAAVAAGGGADAFAARAEAKRALGRPLSDAIADYAEAARLDPRYGEKHRGLVEQLQSESRLVKTKELGEAGAGGVSMNFVRGLGAAGVLLIAIGILYLRRKKSAGKSASEL